MAATSGIGTTNPVAKLEVTGTLQISGGSLTTDCDGSTRSVNGHCYKYFATSLNWSNAELACRSWGGHLASISSYSENKFVGSLTPANAAALIGGTDSEYEGSWSWSSDIPFSYTNWISGEPNGGTTENCLTIYGSTSNASNGWNDAPCGNGYPYICEKGF